jgi:hypothetical protein
MHGAPVMRLHRPQAAGALMLSNVLVALAATPWQTLVCLQSAWSSPVSMHACKGIMCSCSLMAAAST